MTGVQLLVRKSKKVSSLLISIVQGIFFKPYIINKRIEGESFKFLIGDLLGKLWYHKETEAWKEMAFIRDRMIEPDDIVFECGGHHGCSAILLSRWVGDGGKVVTFEPMKQNTNIIKKNLELNNIKNTSVETKAVGATPGTIFISRTSCASITKNKYLGSQVDVINLDSFQHLKPSFLKIDVEGFETEVLRGAKQILSTLPKLAIEIHTDILQQYGTSVRELLKEIDLDAYNCWVQWNDDVWPEPFNINQAINTRVHFFAIPKSDAK